MKRATTNADITNNTSSDTRSWAHFHASAANGGEEGEGEGKMRIVLDMKPEVFSPKGIKETTIVIRRLAAVEAAGYKRRRFWMQC